MAKKNNDIEIDFNEILGNAIKESISEMSANSETGLVNIIDFIDNILCLNTEDRPYFKLIMKMWYYGTPGNESLQITDEDIELIDKIDNYGQGNPWLKSRALRMRNGETVKPPKYFLACLGRRSGKCQVLDSKVLTPNGWVKMGDIKLGDLVITQTGEPTKVIGVYPQGKKDIYKITMSDRSSTECCGEHLWFTWDKSDRKNGFGRRCPSTQHKYQGSVKNTLEIKETLFCDRKDGKKERNHKIPMVEPVKFNHQEIKLDAYLLGMLLGDGSLSSNNIKLTTSDKEVVAMCQELCPEENELISIKSKKYDYSFRANSSLKSMATIIKEIGIYGCVSYTKYIPEEYKINSFDVRLGVFQGLMDSDGTVDSRQGKISYCTTSLQLAEDVKFLVQSFGGTATINEAQKYYTYKGIKKKGRLAYVVQINLPTSIEPFRLGRKKDIYNKFLPKMKEPSRFIDSIEYIGKKEAQCIAVEHPSHLYVTDDFIVTHNTFLSSTIQCYDTYKLLYMNVCANCKDMKNVRPGEDCPDCGTITSRHPQAYFGGGGSEPLRIIMAATAMEQAKDPGLKFYQERILGCNLFDERVIPEAEKTFFKTDYDIKRIEKFKGTTKNDVTKGSIEARAIAANSKAIHGLAAVSIAFDEFGLFSIKGGNTEGYPDELMWEALVPATMQFTAVHSEFGRVVMISAPQFRQGKFYEYYKYGQDPSATGDNYLMVQMPTWEWCTMYTKEFLLEEFAQESQSGSEALNFDKVFGSQFLDEAESSYLSEQSVERAFMFEENKKSRKPKDLSREYFMHIDASSTTCNYALCIVHTERKFCEETSRTELYFVEDYSYFWTPSKNDPDKFTDLEGKRVEIREIWDSIVGIAKDYRVKSLSFDNMQTPESKSYFRKKGLPLRQLSFSGRNKKKEYYGLIKNALQENRIIACSDDLRLRNELLNLKVKETMRGIHIFPNPHGLVRTMDVADCLAGACFMASEKGAGKMVMGSIFRPLPNMLNNNAGKSIFERESINIKKYDF